MKKLAFLLIVLFLIAGLVACGTAMDGGDPDLVGRWDWNGSVYYTFNEGGSGQMDGSSIRWRTDENTLSICITPSSCGDSCIAPTEWTYTLNGDDLTLRNSGMTFSYTRR